MEGFWLDQNHEPGTQFSMAILYVRKIYEETASDSRFFHRKSKILWSRDLVWGTDTCVCLKTTSGFVNFFFLLSLASYIIIKLMRRFSFFFPFLLHSFFCFFFHSFLAQLLYSGKDRYSFFLSNVKPRLIMMVPPLVKFL